MPRSTLPKTPLRDFHDRERTALLSLHMPVPTNTGQEYLFVSNVRFLSMIAVVILHCIFSLTCDLKLNVSQGVIFGLAQPFKFGTIGFFLISGFLMADKIQGRSSSEYLLRRLHTVFAPWLLWFLAYCAVSIALCTLLGQSDFSRGIYAHFFGYAYSCLFDTAFWFVPNLLICLGVLLLCRRFLFDFRLGLTLAACSLFYGLNIYYHWIINTAHTRALLGFVFYLWLGAFAAHHASSLMAWVNRVPMRTMILLTISTFLGTLFEAYVMLLRGFTDYLNTLRISNQLFSVAVALTIFKARRTLWPRFINVRATTYGIYLTHTTLLFLLSYALVHSNVLLDFGRLPGGSTTAVVSLSLAGFFVIYGSSLALATYIFHHPRWRWMVGNFSTSKPLPDAVNSISQAA